MIASYDSGSSVNGGLTPAAASAREHAAPNTACCRLLCGSLNGDTTLLVSLQGIPAREIMVFRPLEQLLVSLQGRMW